MSTFRAARPPRGFRYKAHVIGDNVSPPDHRHLFVADPPVAVAAARFFFFYPASAFSHSYSIFYYGVARVGLILIFLPALLVRVFGKIFMDYRVTPRALSMGFISRGDIAEWRGRNRHWVSGWEIDTWYCHNAYVKANLA